MCACGKKTDDDATANTTDSVENTTGTTTEATQGTENTDATEGTTEGTVPKETQKTEETPKPTTPAPTTPAPTTPAHTHSFSAATCTAPKTCACGATEGAAAGHNYQNDTCVACGAKDNYTHTFGTVTGYVASLSSDGTELDCYQLAADAIYYKTFFAEKPERGYYEIQEHKGKFYYCEAPSWGVRPFESATTSGRTITLESYGETLKIELTTDNKYKLTAGTDAISAGLVFTMGDRCDIIGHNSSVKCEGDVKCWDCDKVLCAGFGHEFGDGDICFRCFEVERPGA